MGGQQLLHVLEEGILPRGVLEAQIQLQLGRIEPLVKLGIFQKALDLAAEHKAVALVVIIKGLDAEMVPGAEQLALGLVPDGKGEHAAQAGDHLPAPFLVAVQQHFGIRMVGGKGMARGLQFGAQGLEVVDLAVEDHHQAAVLVEHGLSALG